MSALFAVHKGFAMVADGRRIDAAEFAGYIDRWKSFLSHMQLPPRSVVGLYASKSPQYCAALMAVMELGLIVVPMFHGLSDAQVLHVVEDSQMHALLADEARINRLSKMALPDGLVRVSLSAAESANDSDVATVPSELIDTGMLIYTSGSTGKPKGIAVSYQNLLLGARSVAHVMRFSPSSQVLCVLPFSFDAGLNQFMCALVAGGTVVMHNFVMAQVLFNALEAQDITTMLGVPGIWSALMDKANGRSFESVRMVGNTGGALTPAMQQGLRQLFPNADLIPMYGFSEAFRGLHMRPSDSARKPRSVGRPIPYASVAVLRTDGSLCDVDEVGQIVQFGPLVSNGYWRNPEANATKFRPIGDQMRVNLRTPQASLYHLDPSHLDQVAWSGDYGKVDAEGDIQFVDRMDDMLKVRGFRINPGDIESVCSSHLNEVCVVVANSNGSDDAFMTLVVKKSLSDIELGHLKNRLMSELPSYMLPHQMLCMGHFPVTANGKIDRASIRNYVAQHSHEGVVL